MGLSARTSIPASVTLREGFVLVDPLPCHLLPAHQVVFACLGGTWWQTNPVGSSAPLGWILIDRCGKHFGTILNYLRDDTITLPQNRQEIKELMAEAKYYLIQGLVNMCQSALQVHGWGGAGWADEVRSCPFLWDGGLWFLAGCVGGVVDECKPNETSEMPPRPTNLAARCSHLAA